MADREILLLRPRLQNGLTKTSLLTQQITAFDFVDSENNMDNEILIEQLRSKNNKKRIEIIHRLKQIIRDQPPSWSLDNQESLFTSISTVLSDNSNANIRIECLDLLREFIPKLVGSIDNYVTIIVPILLRNLDKETPQVRDAIISLFSTYLNYSHSREEFFKKYTHHGLTNDSPDSAFEALVILPDILSGINLTEPEIKILVDSIIVRLLYRDQSWQRSAILALNKIKLLSPHSVFTNVLNSTPPHLKDKYLILNSDSEETSPDSFFESHELHSDFTDNRSRGSSSSEAVLRQLDQKDSVHFGFISSQVYDLLNGSSDPRLRVQAIEDVKSMVKEHHSVHTLLHHIEDFIKFLANLTRDTNFKIVKGTMEIFYELVQRFSTAVTPYLADILNCVTKRLSENNVLVKQANMRLILQLMQYISAKDVVEYIFRYLQHKNSKFRQEAINIIIAALCTFPSYDFNLPAICEYVGPLLADRKKQVRLAALECFAILHQELGPKKSQPLVDSVEKVEARQDGDGAMAAIQFRLGRRMLPRMDKNGLIEYALLPSSAIASSSSTRHVASLLPEGLDTDWIMLGEGNFGGPGLSSGKSREEPFPESLSQTQKRYFSAGKIKTKLPWEETDKSSQVFQHSHHHSSWPPDAMYYSASVDSSRAESCNSTRTEDGRRHRSSSIPLSTRVKKGLNPFTPRGFALDDNTCISSDSSATSYKLPDVITPKPSRLNPISGNMSSVAKSPLPTKPILASAGNGGRLKMPPLTSPSKNDNPITSQHTDPETLRYRSSDSEPTSARSTVYSTRDSAYIGSEMSSPIEEIDDGDDSDDEMSRSLSMIRNSASKKKVAKLFSVLEKPRTLSGVSTNVDSQYSLESGIFTPIPTGGNSLVHAPSPHHNEEAVKPNQSKPPKPTTQRYISGSNNDNSDALYTIDYNPLKGVSIQENTTADVLVVGRGYSDEASDKSVQSKLKYPEKSEKERRRASKTSLHFLSSSQASNEASQAQQVVNEKINIVGKGVFEADRWNSSTNGDPTELIIGKATYKPHKSEPQVQDPLLNVRPSRMQLKNQSDGILQPAFDVSPTNTPARPPVVPKPKKKKSSIKKPPTSNEKPKHEVNRSVVDIVLRGNLPPCDHPSKSLAEANVLLKSDEWEEKCHGLDIIRSLACHNPSVLQADLHQMTIALINEVKNLRTQVSKLAIICFEEMYSSLGKAMDTDLDQSVKILLTKSGDTNHFIKEDSERALLVMAEHCSTHRAIQALTCAGLSHRNANVRKTTARCVSEIVDRIGADKALAGVKDITERIMSAGALFMQDSSPEARYYGRKIYYSLLSHPDFNRCMAKHLTQSTRRNIEDILDTLRTKGLGDLPCDVTSARASRRFGRSVSCGADAGSALNSVGLSSVTCLSGDNPAASVVRTPRRSLSSRITDGSQNEVSSIIELLNSSDWRDRHKGIDEFSRLCNSSPALVMTNIIPVFDKLVLCIKDSNSKVTLFTLQSLLPAIPILKDNLTVVLNIMLPPIISNLSSKNRDIYAAAAQLLDTISLNIDGAFLLQPFCGQAANSNALVKPDLVMRISKLVERTPKPRLIQMHVLPLLWSLVGLITSGSGTIQGASTNLRKSTQALIMSLHSKMGDGLLDAASSNLQTKHLTVLREILNSDMSS